MITARWALHATGTDDTTIKLALEAERDHFLRTSPLSTPEIDALRDALRDAENKGSTHAAKTLAESLAREIAERPHSDTPALVAQMNAAIAAAAAILDAMPDDTCNVSISGSLREQLDTQGTFGPRLAVKLDFVPGTAAAPEPAKRPRK